MPKKNKSIIRSLVTFAAIAIGVYFANTAYQTHLGQKALDATGLEILSLETALAKSKETGKPVLADLSAIWCPSCRQLDNQVLSNEIVKAKIESDYIFTRIEYETDEGKAFMEKHQLPGFPSLLTLDSDGNRIKNLPRTLSPETFLASL
ncbi:MAG: thioredoxin family protein [Verrucomicrobiia bacterium]|jgi:thiol:disulfide interchange protein